MDAIVRAPEQRALAPLLAKLRADFQARLDTLTEAARHWGVQPDHPEGQFISAMIGTQSGFMEGALALGTALDEIVIAARALAEEELARQRVVTHETQLALQGAKLSRESAEIEKARVATQMISDIVPKVVAGVRDAVVIRERRYNRGIEIRRAAYVGCAMLGLFLGGFTLRFVQDWTAVMQLSQSQAAIQHCQDSPAYVDKDGKLLCQIKDFIPRG